MAGFEVITEGIVGQQACISNIPHGLGDLLPPIAALVQPGNLCPTLWRI